MSERLAAEVVVVGAGPAGIAAAVHAAESGRRVLLLEAGTQAGGQVWRHRDEPPRGARPWLARLGGCGARLLTEASVVDAPGRGVLLVERQGRALHVRCDALVLASGARERFLPFPGWTLPGVIGAGAAQALREQGARFDGRSVVVAGSGPLLVAAAAGLRRAGARVVAVAEQAPWRRVAAFAASLFRHPGKLAQAIGYATRLAGVPLRPGTWVREALGRERLERVVLSDGRRDEAWECDVLACGFGLVPNLELARLVGCEAAGDRVVTDELQRTSLASVYAAGELCGIGGVDQARVTGAIAGLVAAGAPVPTVLRRRRAAELAFAGRLARAFALRDELRGLARPDTVVCRCEDVPLARMAAADGARCVKLHTRAGMGACQGRVCGPALRFLFGWGEDTVRPPLLPSAMSVLAEEGEGP